MKNRIIFAAVLVTVFVTSILSTKATDFKLDVKGNKTFSVNQQVGPLELKFVSSAPLEEIIGYVEQKAIKSDVTMDPGNIEKTSGKVSFKIVSLETGISKRDEHLQSPTWLDAGKYPEITFELKELKNVKVTGTDPPAGRSSASATAVGTFTMHGKSKQITVPLKLIYLKESSSTKKRATGDLLSVEGNFSIALKDFDVKGMGDLIGSKVGETIEISLKLFYNSK